MMKKFDFRFTVKCPRCGRLFERNHWGVFASGDSLGVCPGCKCRVILHLAIVPVQYYQEASSGHKSAPDLPVVNELPRVVTCPTCGTAIGVEEDSGLAGGRDR